MSTAVSVDDDPLQQALNEADALMNDLSASVSSSQPGANGDHDSSLGGGGDDDNASSLSREVIGGFSIDEDDDLVEELLHPLHDAFLVQPTNDDAVSSPQAPSAAHDSIPPPDANAASPLQRTPPPSSGSGPYAPGSSSVPASVGSVPPHSSSFVQPSSFSAPQQQYLHHDNTAMDAFKSTTSKFATNLAVFAQRAATTVAAQGAAAALSLNASGAIVPPATYVPGGASATNPNSATGMPYPPQSASLPASVSFPASSSSALVPAVSPALAKAQMTLSGLDKDQKQALLETHVGPLLPGESVIMFLTNLLFVETHDSAHQQLAPNAGAGQALWCCVMTYYRLVLFSTATSSFLGDGDNTSSSSSEADPDAHNAAKEMDAWRRNWNPSCLPPMSNSASSEQNCIEIPLACIDKVEKSVFSSLGSSSQVGLRIHSKLGQVVRFSTLNYPDTTKAQEALSTYAFPGRRNLGYLFAFESKRQAVMDSIVTDADGKKTVTLAAVPARFMGIVEFPRQLQSNTAWKIYTQVNAGYQVCGSYPSVVVGPSTVPMDDTPEGRTVAVQCSAFRSEGRWPCLTWGSAVSGASLWRASQPKVGLQGNRSPHDEWYLRQILECAAAQNATNPPPTVSLSLLQYLTGSPDLAPWMRPISVLPNNSDGGGSGHGASSAPPVLSNRPVLKILDLRPKSSAMANRTGGYGYENTSNYPGTTIQFCGIGNIHAVRDSYQKLLSVATSPRTNDLQWIAAVEDTKWLSHVRLILSAAWESAYWIHVHQLPVLLHCSHGWDRTGQVAVLAQLMLDPYYRTRQGFAVVVEKDFMAFGHPFHTRCSHGEGKGMTDSTIAGVSSSGAGANDDGQVSPIFLQFLDAAYQVVSLYPDCFEFNTKYLLVLSEHIYSCRFGTFLCDTEKEREQMAGIRQRTHCLWEYLESRDDLTNPNYSEATGGGVLLMPLPTLLRHVHLWTDRHCRYSPKPTLRWLPPGMRYADTKYPTQHEMQRLLLSPPCPPSKEDLDRALRDSETPPEKEEFTIAE